ncbi:hypothetical protein VTL71DRAFT_11521 [Oculimacula yallundae]|uniref:2EXR domain-containing protein n=1 Tax=Oculimacula yallundae TaxID=86028 RepID=A0ABR4CR07_9HELO
MNDLSSLPHQTFHYFPQLPTELRLKIYKHILSLSNTNNSSTRILKISYSPSLGTYISNTPPPITLSISSESRSFTLETHSYLSLGPLRKSSKPGPRTIQASSPDFTTSSRLPNSSQSKNSSPLIPITYHHTTLYLSSLSPLLTTHLHTILYDLSLSPSLSLVQSLAIDFRVWAQLCENGFLGIVSRMKVLREVLLVVEFGRGFKGEVGWLEVPDWRRDLKWVAGEAERCLGEERRRGGLRKGREDGHVSVRCVILTRGGEQS